MVRPSRPSPQGTPAALPYPMLSCLSSTSESRAAPHSAVLQAAPAGGALRRARPAGWRQKAV